MSHIFASSQPCILLYHMEPTDEVSVSIRLYGSLKCSKNKLLVWPHLLYCSALEVFSSRWMQSITQPSDLKTTCWCCWTWFRIVHSSAENLHSSAENPSSSKLCIIQLSPCLGRTIRSLFNERVSPNLCIQCHCSFTILPCCPNPKT